MPRIFLVTFLSILMSSCSLVRSVATSTVSDMFYDAGFSLETQKDWQHLREGLPAMVTVNDALLSLDPDDDGFLVTAIKGHAALGFAIHETLYLRDFINLKENSDHKRRAMVSYSNAIELGKRYFAKRGIVLESLVKEDIPKLFDKKLSGDDKDFHAAFFTAQSMGGILNMNKDKMTYISQLPVVKGMFDWVCTHRPDFNYGACDVFYGAYEAGRPKMMGGDPAKGKKIFLDLIEKHPHNWIARVSYMQYYLVPAMDEEGYKKQKFHMEKNMRAFQEAQVWNPEKKDGLGGIENLRVYQAIAVERYKIIKSLEKEIF